MIKCTLHTCKTYLQLLAQVNTYHEQYTFMKERGEETTRIVEALAIAENEKARHVYLCESDTPVPMTAAQRKKWAAVYRGE